MTFVRPLGSSAQGHVNEKRTASHSSVVKKKNALNAKGSRFNLCCRCLEPWEITWQGRAALHGQKMILFLQYFESIRGGGGAGNDIKYLRNCS